MNTDTALAEIEKTRLEKVRLAAILQRAAKARLGLGDIAEARRLRREGLELSWQNLTLRRAADQARLARGDLSGAVRELATIAGEASKTVDRIATTADTLKSAAGFITLLRRLVDVFR